jgi:hypothetical protein
VAVAAVAAVAAVDDHARGAGRNRGGQVFVAGFTPGGAPYGIYEDEMEPCDDPF